VEQRRPGMLLLSHLQRALHQSCAQANATVSPVHCQAQNVEPWRTGQRQGGEDKGGNNKEKQGKETTKNTRENG